MNKIFCNINLFDLNQNVLIVDIQTGFTIFSTQVSDISDLPRTISTLSNNSGISEIVLSGEKTFAYKLKDTILEYAKTNYAINNLEIEVI